eukprot:s3371_g9.t1
MTRSKYLCTLPVAQEKERAAVGSTLPSSGYEPNLLLVIGSMSLSTLRLRRENSRSRSGGVHGGAPAGEDARNPPTRRGGMEGSSNAAGMAGHSDRLRDDRGPGRGHGLDVGLADRRLDALLEEERARVRAASVPTGPEIRRLTLGENHNQGQVGGRPSDSGGHQPTQQSTGVENALTDLRAESLGLGQLQEALRQSFGVLQQELGHRAPEHGLLAPLLQGNDHGAQGNVVPSVRGGQLLFGTPNQGPAVARGPEVQRSGPHQGGDHSGAGRGMQGPPSGHQAGGQVIEPRREFWIPMHRLVNVGHQRIELEGKLVSRWIKPDGRVDIEKIKARCLRDAEEAFAREMKRLGVVDKNEVESYHTASSQGAQHGEGHHGGVPNGSGGGGPPGMPPGGNGGGYQNGPDPPPGLNNVRISFDGAGSQPISESLRHLELPALPVVGSEGAALQFGDWMTMAHPLMSDLGMTAKTWWEKTVGAAEGFYTTWLEASPLERLRLKPMVEVDPVFNRLEQRGISMLLAILPEGLRRDVVGSRNVSTVSILYRLYVVFQPGGGAERSALLKSLTDVRVRSNIQDVLATMEEMGGPGFGVESGSS